MHEGFLTFMLSKGPEIPEKQCTPCFQRLLCSTLHYERDAMTLFRLSTLKIFIQHLTSQPHRVTFRRCASTVNLPSGDPESTQNFCHFWCAHVVAILCSKEREKEVCPHPSTPTLFSFNQNSVCWRLEKMSAYLPCRCVSPHLLFPSSVLFLGFYSFF